MRTFKDIFEDFDVDDIVNEASAQTSQKSQSPEDVLRNADIKIKNIIPTNFGTEIILAKRYDENDIKKILAKFNIKIKQNSVFVES